MALLISPSMSLRVDRRSFNHKWTFSLSHPAFPSYNRALQPVSLISLRSFKIPNALGTSSAMLQDLDRLLAADDEVAALRLVTSLCESGELRAFGAGSGVPKRLYTLEELRLNKINPSEFLSPADTTLNQVRSILQSSFVVGLIAAYFTHAIDITGLVQWSIMVGAILTVDQVANAGGVEALLVDTAGRMLSPTYARRVALHESGHFLVAYLLGFLPKDYTLSSWDAFSRHRTFNIQAGTTFCDSEFQKEIASGKLSSSSLDVYSCVALAGVATEWLRFGHAEGGLSDVQQLDRLLNALGFTQKKADSEVRWAVLNTVTLLREHETIQDQLADGLAAGLSVGECIRVIENCWKVDSDRV